MDSGIAQIATGLLGAGTALAGSFSQARNQAGRDREQRIWDLRQEAYTAFLSAVADVRHGLKHAARQSVSHDPPRFRRHQRHRQRPEPFGRAACAVRPVVGGRSRTSRSAGPAGFRVALAHQIAVPSQDRVRADEQMQPAQ